MKASLPDEIINSLFSPTIESSMDWLLKHINLLTHDLDREKDHNELIKPYARKLLFQDARGEILLMKWTQNLFCSPHDHAKASGFVLFLEGEFIERDYTFTTTLIKRGERRVHSPAIFPFELNRIHDMACTQNGLSLHVYTPAISGMKVYDSKEKRTLKVSDSSGAWIPQDPGEIHDIEYWP